MAAPLTVAASAPTRYAGRPPLKSRDNSEDDDDSGKETPDNEIADAATMRRIPNKARTSRHFRDHAKRDLPGSRPRVACQFNHRWVAAATRSNNQSSDSKPYARTVAQHLVIWRGTCFFRWRASCRSANASTTTRSACTNRCARCGFARRSRSPRQTMPWQRFFHFPRS
jgi:hypothetical protein